MGNVAEGKAAFQGFTNSHTEESGLNDGKSGRLLHPAARPPNQPRACPYCGSTRVWLSGTRDSDVGPLQKYECRSCRRRFSEKKPSALGPLQIGSSWSFNRPAGISKNRQVCELLTEGPKNLIISEAQHEGPLCNSTKQDTKGKLVEYAWHMEKQAYAAESIRGNTGCLRALIARNADLFNPDSVKEALAKEKAWSQNRRRNVINAYTLFLKINGLTWEKPRCNVVRKIPFIPMEEEIDQLIAGCPKKTATFLQLLKETAMRSGEAKRLLWTDVDFQRRIITLNDPEKNGLPRIWNKLSSKLLDMLNALPRKSIRVFGDSSINAAKATFTDARRRLAEKLQNPRQLQIHFHTPRHWKATMEYHTTKDILHVMQFLGHKKIDTTLIYIQLDQKLFSQTEDSFITRIAHNVDEAAGLVEVGFEYVTGEYNDGGKLFRKRK